MFLIKFLIFVFMIEFGSLAIEDTLRGKFTRCKDDCTIVKEVKFVSNNCTRKNYDLTVSFEINGIKVYGILNANRSLTDSPCKFEDEGLKLELNIVPKNSTNYGNIFIGFVDDIHDLCYVIFGLLSNLGIFAFLKAFKIRRRSELRKEESFTMPVNDSRENQAFRLENSSTPERPDFMSQAPIVTDQAARPTQKKVPQQSVLISTYDETTVNNPRQLSGLYSRAFQNAIPKTAIQQQAIQQQDIQQQANQKTQQENLIQTIERTIKCNCNSGQVQCTSKHCPCKKAGLVCWSQCHVKKTAICDNFFRSS